MILPTTGSAVLLLLTAALLCWGSWANAQKMTGKWRFELFYYDFSLGVLLLALAAAFTLGQMAPQELTFSDNFLIASKRQMVYAVAAGVVFNLANILLAGAISVAGMSVAFPLSLGLAAAIGAVWTYAGNPNANGVFLFGGAALALAAIIVAAFAFSSFLDTRQEQEKASALRADPRSKKAAPRPTGAARGILLGLASGIVMGFFPPLIDMARLGESGVAPYGLALLFGAGVLASSLFYLPFFLNFPVNGPPIETRQYFKGSLRQHLTGVLGGVIWMTGGLCYYAAASAPRSAQLNPTALTAFGQGAAIASALWGMLAWREFKGSNFNIKMLLVIVVVLLGAGLAMISIAPLHAA